MTLFAIRSAPLLCFALITICDTGNALAIAIEKSDQDVPTPEVAPEDGRHLKKRKSRRQALAKFFSQEWVSLLSTSESLRRASSEETLGSHAGSTSGAHTFRHLQHRHRRAKGEDATLEDSTLLWIIAFVVFCGYMFVLRAFFLAENPPQPPKQPVPKAPPVPLGISELQHPAMAHYVNKDHPPRISKLQLHDQTPLAVPLTAQLDADWSIDIVGCHGKPLLFARLRSKDIIEIIDRQSKHIVATIDRQLKIKGLGGRTPFASLVQETQQTGLPRFMLKEESILQPRAAIDIGPTGNHMSMFLTSGTSGTSSVLATIERRFGHVTGNARGHKSRSGEYLEITTNPSVDVVVVVACMLGITSFVMTPEPGSVEVRMQREAQAAAADRPTSQTAPPPLAALQAVGQSPAVALTHPMRHALPDGAHFAARGPKH